MTGLGRALVVDDHPFMRAAVRHCLEGLGFSGVDEAASLEEAHAVLGGAVPAVAVLDLRLPDGLALDLAAALVAAGSKVLAFTGADDSYTVHAAFTAGVTGYVLKSALPEVVAHAVREVLAGRVFADAPVTSLLVHRVQQAVHVDLSAVTDRDLALLRLVAEGLSNAEIGERLGVTALSVKGLLTRIGRRLGTSGDRTEMVAAAMRAELLQ